MALRLDIVSRHKKSLGERGVKEFGPAGGTIGRSLESDWVLPDGQRFLSSRHASIDFRSGSYYIVDTSTNGVFINDAEKPVGRGNPQRLFNGDRVRIGDYEILVAVDEPDSAHESLPDTRHVDPVDAAQHVESPEPTSYDLVDAFEITGVGIEYLLDEDQAETLNPPLTSESDAGYEVTELSLADSGAQRTVPDARHKPQKRQPAASGAKPDSPAKKAGKQGQTQQTNRARGKRSSAPAPTDASKPLEAFLKAAGLPAKKIDDQQAAQIMQRLGQVFRETVVGLTENLHLRAAQKSRLRQPNTTIQPRENNPLKFSASVEEAMSSLVFRESSEYLSAVEAVRDAFKDIKLHQQSMLNAMQAAVSNYVARLDPDQLEENFGNGKRGPLMNAANKLKYWDFYKDLYLVVAQHPAGALPAQFVEELSRAYEQELAKGDTPSERKLKAG